MTDHTDELVPFDPSPEDDMAVMERIAADKGKKGDLGAIEISRRIKQGRARTVRLDLPALSDAASIAACQATVIAAAAAERITPRDALIFSTLIENRRRALETLDHEERLIAIEEAHRARDKKGGKG
jgi:hypothetical protein